MLCYDLRSCPAGMRPSCRYGGDGQDMQAAISPSSLGTMFWPGRPHPLCTPFDDPVMWLDSGLVVNIKQVLDMLMYTLQLPLPHRPGSAALGVNLRAPLGHVVRTIIVSVVPDRVPPPD